MKGTEEKVVAGEHIPAFVLVRRYECVRCHHKAVYRAIRGGVAVVRCVKCGLKIAI